MKRIAVIGCGAIANSFHLPALTKHQAEPLEVVLVDLDVDRARELGERFGLGDVASHHAEVADRIDGAIIASPHTTHAPIAMDLVRRGVPVLSEKPLGTSVAEVEELRDLAEAERVVVAVNQTRRFIPACGEVRRMLMARELGDLVSIDANEGDRFGWPAATPSMFGARSGGKGLLLDIGAHVLDLLVWWLGASLELVEYRDDSFGGSEASSLVRLRSGPSDIRVRLSWLAKQRNSYVITGSSGRLEWGVYDLDEVRLTSGERGQARVRRLQGAPGGLAALGSVVLSDFLRAVDGQSKPVAGPDDVLPSLRLIEACYARREPFDMRWHGFATAAR